MDETYRMLAREHVADFEREAEARRLARLAGPKTAREQEQSVPRRRRRAAFRLRLRVT
jgi:hypothetical protein